MTPELAKQIVDGLNDLYGAHAGFRAAHAKGTYCRGTFTAAPAAAQLTSAPHMQGTPVRALVRFSNGSGDPHIHDGTVDGRGMAVKFELPDGHVTDIVAVTLPVFFVRTPEDFLEFVRTRKPQPETGRPDDAAVIKFIEAHPEALPAVQATLAAKPPASYLRVAYNAIHAFRFVDSHGGSRYVRYRWEPDEGESYLDPHDASDRSEDYLRRELADRLAAGKSAMRLYAQVAADSDPTDDPTAAWPAERTRVELGRLDVTATADDPERDGAVVVFDPTRVIDGIELSDDKILRAREHAYSESVARRAR